MKFLGTVRIRNAIVFVWEDDKGRIILGGIGWFEFNDYERLFSEKKEGTE